MKELIVVFDLISAYEMEIGEAILFHLSVSKLSNNRIANSSF
jgi:hypothetical protein